MLLPPVSGNGAGPGRVCQGHQHERQRGDDRRQRLAVVPPCQERWILDDRRRGLTSATSPGLRRLMPTSFDVEHDDLAGRREFQHVQTIANGKLRRVFSG